MTNAALRGRPDKAALRTTQTGNRLAKALVAFAALLCFGTATALAGSINLSEVTANTIVADGMTLTGTLGANVKISIADGATVTLDGVTINGENDYNCRCAGITCEGDATIVLKGVNKVKGFYERYPGIYVPYGKTLTIKGDGSLDASSNGNGAAGIGGGDNISCGNIAIEGGTMAANMRRASAADTTSVHAATSPSPAARLPRRAANMRRASAADTTTVHAAQSR